MKIWLDEHTKAPEGYEWAKTAKKAIKLICEEERYHEVAHLEKPPINDISIPMYGEEACALADWLDETDRDYPVSLHAHHGSPIEESLYNEKSDMEKHRNNRMHQEVKEVARLGSPKWTFIIKA